jgi:hypothetical protein
MTEEVTLQTSKGAAKERDVTDGTDEPTSPTERSEPDEQSSGSALDNSRQTDMERLQERGVALHGLSEDEEEDTDEEGAQEMTEEEMASAKAVLDDPSYDQEGLALTGGDWFSTIKKAALESKLTEKELAARMKKAKISQSSLENEVFLGPPSSHSSADTSSGTLQNVPPPLQLKTSPARIQTKHENRGRQDSCRPRKRAPPRARAKKEKKFRRFPPSVQKH